MYRCLVCGSRFAVYTSACSHCWAAHSLALTQWQDAGLPAYASLALRRGALVVVFGSAGSGKSTFAARALDSLQAPSLLVSVEEPAGPSLAERLARVGAKDDHLLVCSRATVDQVADIVRRRKVGALGVDSVQRAMFEPRELRHLLQVLPSLALVIAVSQVNRDGDVRGGEELAHEADVVIEIAAFRWTVRKSRYQPAGASGAVLAVPTTPTEDAHVSA